MKPSISGLFDRFDKNKDGKLTKDEVPAMLWEHLSKADANKDGAVTKEELEAYHKKMREEFQQQMKGFGGSHAGPPHGGPQGFKPPSVDELFERFDKNKDGKLTKDEVPAMLWEHLSKADANKDGAVTKEELQAARKQMEERWKQHQQPPK